MSDSGYLEEAHDVPASTNTPISDFEVDNEDPLKTPAVGVVYVPPQLGQHNLSLNHQPPLIHVLMKAAIHYMVGEILFKNAYLPLSSQEAFIRALLTKLAASMAPHSLLNLVHSDEQFVWLATQRIYFLFFPIFLQNLM